MSNGYYTALLEQWDLYLFDSFLAISSLDDMCGIAIEEANKHKTNYPS